MSFPDPIDNPSPHKRHIILTGFMGSGKSSVGRLLARQLARTFVDLDAVIVSAAGMSINEIFAQEGEAAFRSRERECLVSVLQQAPSVLATGGGVVISADNRNLMRSKGIVINLTVSLQQVMERLKGADDRPLLSGDDAAVRAVRLMEEREQFYTDADIRIDTDGKSVEDVAAEILNYVKGLRL